MNIALTQIAVLANMEADHAQRKFVKHINGVSSFSSTGGDLAADTLTFTSYLGSLEYQYIIEHSEDEDLQGRSYFAMAYVLDEQLKQYDDALLGYQNAIQLAKDPVIQAQSYYRSGLIYQESLDEQNKAVDMYEALVKNYSGSSDSTINAMVADAGLRKSELYAKLGRLDDALVDALATLKRTYETPNATIPQKVSAQYNLGFLHFDKAQSLFSIDVGTDLQPYIDASRQSANAYFAVGKAAPINRTGP